MDPNPVKYNLNKINVIKNLLLFMFWLEYSFQSMGNNYNDNFKYNRQSMSSFWIIFTYCMRIYYAFVGIDLIIKTSIPRKMEIKFRLMDTYNNKKSDDNRMLANNVWPLLERTQMHMVLPPLLIFFIKNNHQNPTFSNPFLVSVGLYSAKILTIFVLLKQPLTALQVSLLVYL